jgi:hypothetical protein
MIRCHPRPLNEAWRLMPPNRIQIYRFVFVFCLLTSCDDTTLQQDGGLRVDADVSLYSSYADYCPAYLGALVNFFVRCFGGDDAYYRRLLVSCEISVADVDQSPVRFQPAAASACLDALSSPRCDFSWAEVCGRVLDGTLELGSECGGGECQPGLECRTSTISPDCVMTCQQTLTSSTGGRCGPSMRCETGSICISTGDANRCVRLPTAGEACVSGRCGDTEVGRGWCEMGICRMPRSESESCDFDEQCGVGLYCATRDGGICRPWRRPGDACQAESIFECGYIAYCSPAQNCVLPRLDGEPCGFTEGRCASGYYCDVSTSSSANGFCSQRKPIGSPCASSEECDRGLECYGFPRLCGRGELGCAP